MIVDPRVVGPTHDSAWDRFASDDPGSMAARFPDVHGSWQTGWWVGVLVALVLAVLGVWWLARSYRRDQDSAEARVLTDWYQEILPYTGRKVRPAVPHTHSDLGWPDA